MQNDEIKEMKDVLKSLGNKQAVNLYAYIESLEQRIEKAVEYLKDNAKYQKATINNNKYYSEYLINQVLNILNGRSDE